MTPADQPGVEGIMSEADYYYLYGNADGYTAYSILARELVRLADAVRDDKTPLDSCYSTDTVAFLRHIVLTRACQPVSALRAPVAAQERQEPGQLGALSAERAKDSLSRAFLRAIKGGGPIDIGVMHDELRKMGLFIAEAEARPVAGREGETCAFCKAPFDAKGECRCLPAASPAPAAPQDELLTLLTDYRNEVEYTRIMNAVNTDQTATAMSTRDTELRLKVRRIDATLAAKEPDRGG